MTELVGDGKARCVDIVVVVIDNYPAFAVKICFCILTREQIVYSAVLLYVNVGFACNFYNVYGQAADIVINETLPSTVSDICVDFIIHCSVVFLQ